MTLLKYRPRARPHHNGVAHKYPPLWLHPEFGPYSTHRPPPMTWQERIVFAALMAWLAIVVLALAVGVVTGLTVIWGWLSGLARWGGFA